MTGPPSRQEERTPGALAEAGGEERRLPDSAGDAGLDLRRERREPSSGGGSSDGGEANTMPSSDQTTSTSPAVLVLEPLEDGRGPRRVDARPERREEAHAPVADLVAVALEDDPGRSGCPHAATCSATYATRFLAALSSRPCRLAKLGLGVLRSCVRRARVQGHRSTPRRPADARPCRRARTASCPARLRQETPGRGRA